MITDLLLQIFVPAIPVLEGILSALGLGAAGYSLWKGSKANLYPSMKEIFDLALEDESVQKEIAQHAAAKLDALDNAAKSVEEVYGGEHLYNITNPAQGYGNIDINSAINNAYIKQLEKKEKLNNVLKFNVSDYINNEEFNSTPILTLSESYTTPRVLTWKELVTNPAENEILETELTPVIEEFPSTPLDYVNGIRSLSRRKRNKGRKKNNRGSNPNTSTGLEVEIENEPIDATYSHSVIIGMPQLPPVDEDPEDKEESSIEETQTETGPKKNEILEEPAIEEQPMNNEELQRINKEQEDMIKSLQERIKKFEEKEKNSKVLNSLKKIGHGAKDVGIGTWNIIKKPYVFGTGIAIGSGVTTEEIIHRNNNKQKERIEKLENVIDSIKANNDSIKANNDTIKANNDTTVTRNGKELTVDKVNLENTRKWLDSIFNKDLVPSNENNNR